MLETSTVYGPVKSWRFGNSLGVDPILHGSVCSFNCIYCQLGYIQKITKVRKEFVPTNRIIYDLKKTSLSNIHVITVSGNGEPTLATNIGVIAKKIHKYTSTSIPLHILTNATLFHLNDVKRNLQYFDEVCCKLDAIDNINFQKINRPVADISLTSIIEGITQFRKEYNKVLTLQIAILPNKLPDKTTLIEVLKSIQPNRVYLNNLKRPYPKSWKVQYRGDHTLKSDQQHDAGKTLPMVSNDGFNNWIDSLIPLFPSGFFSFNI